MRFVLDTNVLINGISDDLSAASRLIEAALDGEIEVVVTHRILKEYRLILRRLINDPAYKSRIQEFFDVCQIVKAAPVDVVIDDRQDLKFIEAAVAGQAETIVTDDKHLLEIGEYESVKMRKPTEAWNRLQEESSGGEWHSLLKNIGIGIFIFLAVTTTLTPVLAQAEENASDQEEIDESVQKLEEQRAQISEKETEIKQLEAKIKELSGKRDNTAAEAELIASQVKRLADQLAKAELELKQTQLSIKVTNQQKTNTEKDIIKLEESIESRRNTLKGLLRILYEREQESFIRVFFDTWSLSDMLSERAAYKELQDRTIALVSDMKKEAGELKAKQEQLEEQAKSLSSLAEALNLQQDDITSRKKDQQQFLQAKKDQQVVYEQKIAEVEAAKEEIKKQVFTLKGLGVELSLNNAFDMARFAGKLTGVRPALLLGVLKVESNLGNNVGSGRYPNDMHPASRDAFLRITKKLGLDPFTTPVSRRPSSNYGWGGAMGPGQFMPATWEGIEARLATLLNKSVPNPYELTDAFVATAVFLADRGATSQAGEYEAVNKYIAGPYWQYHTWYGDRVLAVAAEYEKQGL